MSTTKMSKEELAELKELIAEFALKNIHFDSSVAQNMYTVCDIIHKTSLSTINYMYDKLSKVSEKAEKSLDILVGLKDEENQQVLIIEKKKRFLFLVYKYIVHRNEQESKQKEFIKKKEELAKLIEENKTPEERIKEMQDAIKKLEEEI